MQTVIVVDDIMNSFKTPYKNSITGLNIRKIILTIKVRKLTQTDISDYNNSGQFVIGKSPVDVEWLSVQEEQRKY